MHHHLAIKHKSKGVQIDSNECDFESTGDDDHNAECV